MIRPFLENHVFANLTFTVILVVGGLCYAMLPRQQDPEMNFNWIQITTALPGAATEDVEKLITDPLEEALEKLDDVRFVVSHSLESTSSILVRFDELESSELDKRINDLRREVRNKQRELPDEAEDPWIFEITSSSGFPSATVVVQGQGGGENLRQQARHIKRDMERIKGVGSVMALGLREPEIHIRFDARKLVAMGLQPSQLADTLSARFRDFSAGNIRIGRTQWTLRVQGTSAALDEIANWSVVGSQGELPLGDVAAVSWARERAAELVTLHGKPGVMLSLTKAPNTNVLVLNERVQGYVDQRNALGHNTGITLALVDDQTHMIREALNIMRSNALLGLLFVILATWLFLGSRIALLIGLGIPFTLAGTFMVLYAMGETLNVMVLLGVVIALGMLVDDAVVVVEGIYDRIRRGWGAIDAGIDSLREVFAPVTASVLTTMAAFMPLMLLPGILGEFMRVVPLTVTLALAFSLVEAYWMLPAHVSFIRMRLDNPGRMQRMRNRVMHQLRIRYARTMIMVFRRPKLFMLLAILPLVIAIGAVATERVRMEFFAMEKIPLFYINVKMPAGSSLEQTLAASGRVAERARAVVKPGEAVSIFNYAGQMFTETKPEMGDRYGQVFVSLNPDRDARRSVDEIIDAMRPTVTQVAGPTSIDFLPISGGPPVTKPISVKVRGSSFETILEAVQAVKSIVAEIEGSHNLSDSYASGRPQLNLVPNDDAIRRAGLSSDQVMRSVRLLGDGEVVAQMQHRGEKVSLRVLGQEKSAADLDSWMTTPFMLPNGQQMELGRLLDATTTTGQESIMHFNFKRTIKVEADLDQMKTDAKKANAIIKTQWAEKYAAQFPDVDLDFTGVLDDIEESQNAIFTLFLFGAGVMYMILGAQFRSYFQPMMILTTLPMAFTGVIFGLLVTGHAMSLYTLYGVVALAGIAVNAAIVLISAANSRLRDGMSVTHAIIYAGRRRVVPILITSLTTIAGLFSLAAGLAGTSVMWGTIATAMVWGLAVSTLLTLFLVPLLYLVSMRPWHGKRVD
uniref:Acriflavin resistance protein n=1 Tax=Magnetococcus massalia (strain MO-1) TaxID=451514 RepID=A0A1S7LL10_MAGMO|nr:Acriflavin resistance protein [Candidatus Magnetococcus massalia]